MDIRNTKLEPDQFYHIFNRGINGMSVFFESKNYDYFLQQYAKYVYPYVRSYAYCLLDNHFHLLIKVRSEEELLQVIQKDKDKPFYWHVSNAFSSFFQSYTRAINNMYDRSGSLFESRFKRIAVTNEAYFTRLINYIHLNPVKHGFIEDFRKYPYSSYHAHLSSSPTKLERKEVLEWFGGTNAYIDFHMNQEISRLDQALLLE